MKVKRLLASFLAASLTFSMSATAFAADAKLGGKAAANNKFSEKTVFFDVKGKVQDIYEVNKDTEVGTFKQATEYFLNRDTEFTRWMNFETGVYHLKDDTEVIPNQKAVWTAQFKAPTTGQTKPTDVVSKNEVADAIAGADTDVMLGNALYTVEAAAGDKMGTAAKGSSESIKLEADAKKALSEQGKDVVFSTGIASLTVPANVLVDSFEAKITKANEAVAGLTNAVQYDLTANGGSHTFTRPVEVSVPVSLSADKTVYVYYLDNNGTLKSRMSGATYDSQRGVVTFETTHFSSYAISTELKSDVPVEDNGSGGDSSSDSNKPSVSVSGAGGRVSADSNGNVTIIPDRGYRVKDVTVNGKSVGAVESLKNLKPTDKVVVTFEKITTDPSGWANPFTDVATGAWYYDAVRYAYENKLFSGITSDKFGPNQNMTRAMLVTVLYRHSGATETGTASFADVPADAYYTNAVAWAEKNKIVTGIDAKTFAPNNNITREQIAAILNRYAKFSGKSLPTGSLNFSDAAQISAYAKADVATMQAAGIVNGRSNNVFAPKASATRAEVATMIMRYIQYVG